MKVLEVLQARLVCFPGLFKLLEGIFAESLQHGIARLVFQWALYQNKGFIDQCSEKLECRGLRVLSCQAFRSLERPAAREDRKMAKKLLLLSRKQPMTPIDHRLQGLVTCQGSPSTSQQVESIPQLRRDLLNR